MKTRVGDRVELVRVDDDVTSLKFGDQGVVRFIDSTGTVHIEWDNGSNLGLLPWVDEWKVVT